jgi:hypothetical protein
VRLSRDQVRFRSGRRYGELCCGLVSEIRLSAALRAAAVVPQGLADGNAPQPDAAKGPHIPGLFAGRNQSRDHRGRVAATLRAGGAREESIARLRPV